MKNPKRLACCLSAALLFVAALAACAAPASTGASGADVQAVWDERLVSLLGDGDAEGLAESLSAGNDPELAGGFTSAEAPGDGTVVVTYTAEQAEAALEDLREELDDAQSAFPEDYPGCSIEVSDDCRALEVRLTEDVALSEGLAASRAGAAAIMVQYRMVQVQLLAESDEPWSLTVELFDADDGRLIATYEDVFSLDYDSVDWEVSE